MPKITLTNSESGKDEDFEPVDAREILAQANTIYTVPQATRDEIGRALGPDSKDINIPQMHDPEMQTGLSIEKYGRAAIVKAQAGMPKPPTTTLGEPIVEEPIGASTMSKSQLQSELSQRRVAYSATASKGELQAAFDKASSATTAQWAPPAVNAQRAELLRADVLRADSTHADKVSADSTHADKVSADKPHTGKTTSFKP